MKIANAKKEYCIERHCTVCFSLYYIIPLPPTCLVSLFNNKLQRARIVFFLFMALSQVFSKVPVLSTYSDCLSSE